MAKKQKASDKITVTFELDDDTYFQMLQACIDAHITIDEFVESALKNFIKNKKGKS